MDVHVERNPVYSWTFAVCYEGRWGEVPYQLVGTIVKVTDTVCEIRNVLGEIRQATVAKLKERIKELGFESAVVRILHGNKKARVFGHFTGTDERFDYYRVDL